MASIRSNINTLLHNLSVAEGHDGTFSIDVKNLTPGTRYNITMKVVNNNKQVVCFPFAAIVIVTGKKYQLDLVT